MKIGMLSRPATKVRPPLTLVFLASHSAGPGISPANLILIAAVREALKVVRPTLILGHLQNSDATICPPVMRLTFCLLANVRSFGVAIGYG